MLVADRQIVLISASAPALMAGTVGAVEAVAAHAPSAKPPLRRTPGGCRGKPDGDYSYPDTRHYYYSCTNGHS
jgi:hypothetical protein